MTTTIAPTSTSMGAAPQVATQGHVGLVVLSSIAAGLAMGLLLVLGAFAGGDEPHIVGSALLALGVGFALLAVASTRLTSQPQRWAVVPGVASMVAGLGILVLAPGQQLLDLAGWIWPVLLAILVASSFRGARRALDNWSRRALLYPALVVLSLIAVGGAAGTVATVTSSNPAPVSGHTYRVNGHRLYLNCVGSGSPTIVLFNGLGEWTPNWAWVQANVSATARICAFDRAGEGWSGDKATRQDGHELASDLHELLHVAHVAGPYVLAGHSVGGTYALVYAEDYPAQVAGVALIDSATPYQFDLPAYRSFYSTFKRASAILPVAARTVMGRSLLRSGFGSLPPRARRRTRLQLIAAPADSEPARVPATAGRLQPGESSPQPSWQAARRPERKRRRDERLGVRPGQARTALDEQHPPDCCKGKPRSTPRRQELRHDHQ